MMMCMRSMDAIDRGMNLRAVDCKVPGGASWC